MVRFGVREKIMVIFFILLFVPIITLGFVSVYEVNKVGSRAVNDSRDSLSDQAEKHLMNLVRDKANETNAFFESIESDTKILTDFGNDLYNNPENYHNGSNYPDYEYSSNTVSYLPSWGYVHTASDERRDVVVAFIHVEPKDTQAGSSAETKLVKNAKWLARKWDVKQILLHSFTHLAQEKADPEQAKLLMDRAHDRLEKAEYDVSQTPYGYFNDLSIDAKGHPLARIFKEF